MDESDLEKIKITTASNQHLVDFAKETREKSLESIAKEYIQVPPKKIYIGVSKEKQYI